MNTPNSYSGGRFYTMFLAIAAAQNHEVYYISNVKPIFTREFESYYNYNNIHYIIDKNYNFKENIRLDIILIIPDLAISIEWFFTFYLKAILRANKDNAKILLLNFETPNWFNALSEKKRDIILWKHWEKTSKYSDGVLSSVKTAIPYAEEFFDNKELKYYYCYPAINQKVADEVQKLNLQKKDEIIIFARFIDPHKGSFELLEVLTKKLENYTLKIVIGNGDIPSDFKEKLQNRADELNIKIIYLYKITDYEKFVEISTSRFLLFLSDFEGFGSPPIEALYMNTPVIAKYLDVLFEVSGNEIKYINSIEEFKTLNLRDDLKYNLKYNENIEINNYFKNINNIFLDLSRKNIDMNYLKKIKLKLSSYLYNLIYSRYIWHFFRNISFKEKEKELLSSKKVLIFGIGDYSILWSKWCEDNKKDIRAYVVSSKSSSEFYLGRKVISLNQIKEYDFDIIIITTFAKDSAENIVDILNVESKKIFFMRNNNQYIYDLTNKRIIINTIQLIYKISIKKLITLIYKFF
jgi:hypothetical protein